MRSFRHIFVFLPLLLSLSAVVSAQNKAKPRVLSTPTPKPTPTAVGTPVPASSPPEKKNGRPTDTAVTRKAAERSAALTGYTPAYFYKFEREGFIYSLVKIEHDEAGKGKIAFQKNDSEETIEDPIALSTTTLEKLTAAFTALNFLESTEVYQTEMDHSNIGQVTIALKKSGKQREASYNWTNNKDAKALMDEYRRISNEYTWKFEMMGARENQNLLTPGLMDAIDRYLDRNEISDPRGLMPFLTELSLDERLPLIARNHAARLVKQITKQK